MTSRWKGSSTRREREREVDIPKGNGFKCQDSSSRMQMATSTSFVQTSLLDGADSTFSYTFLTSSFFKVGKCAQKMDVGQVEIFLTLTFA